MTEWFNNGVVTKLCFEMTLSSQNLLIPNYSTYRHFIYETITEMRNKRNNDVQIANWLNDNGHKHLEKTPSEITMFILSQRRERED